MRDILNKPLTASLLWGIIGGALLVLMQQLSHNALIGMSKPLKGFLS